MFYLSESEEMGTNKGWTNFNDYPRFIGNVNYFAAIL